MVIRKSVKATMERMGQFEIYELGCSESVRGRLNPEGDPLEEILDYILEKRYLDDCGALAALYESYMEHASKYTPEERETDEIEILKYQGYIRALEDRYAYPQRDMRPEDYLEREAICYVYKRDVNGDLKLNESFNARMMVDDHGEDIRYCAPWKTWLIWNGSVWKADQENQIYRLAGHTLVQMRHKASKLPVQDEMFRMMDHAGQCETVHKFESMIKGTSWRPGISILPDKLDADPWLFNCANGTIDCRNGRLLPHEKSKLITMTSPVPYDIGSLCLQWKAFLKSIFKGNHQLIRYIQKAVGCCLSGDTSVQSMFILYGTGANGKSTFINTIMSVMGDYAATSPPDTFLLKKGDQANNDIARLKGKRFVSAMESELGGRLAEAMVKRLTGDDVISARFLYGEYFDFKPTFKIFMATNHKPKVGGMDEAIWRRLKLIPFEVSIPPEKQDKNLKEKLQKELTGIFSWIVEGCLMWLNEGLGHVEAVDRAVEEYRSQMSSIEAFLESECIRDDYGRVKISEMYTAFVSWCESSNERIISKRAFGIRLDEMDVSKCRDSECWYRVGWRMKR